MVMKKKRKIVEKLQSSILKELWEQVNKDELVASINQNIETMQIIWNHCDDFKITPLTDGTTETQFGIVACWMDGLVDEKRVQEIILHTNLNQLMSSGTNTELISLQTGMYQAIATYQEASRAIAAGQLVFFMEGNSKGFSISVSNFPSKALETPQNEPTIEEPQVSFVNVLSQNIATIRNFVRSPHLKVEIRTLGSMLENSVALLYLDSVIEKEVVDEVKKRLSSYQLEGVLGFNYVKEILEDHPYSPYPTIDETERPDRVAVGLLQGKFAILVNGSTIVLLAPATFITFINPIEDYYTGYEAVVFFRVMRHLMYWISMLLPSIYISLLSYNQDLLPTPLLLNLQIQHQNLPFSVILEIFIMQIAFEAMREAGTRLPKTVGQSVSIVGTLVIGDAATQAGLVTPAAVIVVAFTGIASFTITSYALAYTNRVLQFAFMLSAFLYGLYGVIIVGLMLVAHLVSLKSFGVPYMSPVAPFHAKVFPYAFYRPSWSSENRYQKDIAGFPRPDLEKLKKTK